MTKSDSELDNLGRVNPKDVGCTPLEVGIHEWSEWCILPEMTKVEMLDGECWYEPDVSSIKIRVCKKCKQAQFDII